MRRGLCFDLSILSGNVLFDGVLHEVSSFVGLWQVESWLVTETVFTTLKPRPRDWKVCHLLCNSFAYLHHPTPHQR